MLWNCEIQHPIWFEEWPPVETQELWKLILARIYLAGNRMRYGSKQITLHQHICVILWIGYKMPYIAAWMTSCKCEGWSSRVHKGNPRKSGFVLVRQGWRICAGRNKGAQYEPIGTDLLQQIAQDDNSCVIKNPLHTRVITFFRIKTTITSSHKDLMSNTSLQRLTRKRFQKFK